jgi:integrase
MPAEQRGSIYQTPKAGYAIRWRDADGQRHHRSGFAMKRDARRWLRAQLDSPLRDDRLTFDDLADRYLVAHAVNREPSTIQTLRDRLVRPRRAFGTLDLVDLERRVREVAEWQATLPEGSRFGIVQAFRQTLDAGVRWGYMRTNPAKVAGRNVQTRRAEVVPFTVDEVDRLAAELGPVWGALVVFAAETGLRPEEWIPLERRDVLRGERVVQVARTYSRGRLKPYGKTNRSLRRVPLSLRAVAALEELPPRLGSPLVWPASRGGYVDLHNWRRRSWRTACEAAGIGPGRRIYDLRHTAISHWLAAGLPPFDVARFAGTSVRMIDLTYGHLVASSEAAALERLDVWASRGRGTATGESATDG